MHIYYCSEQTFCNAGSPASEAPLSTPAGIHWPVSVDTDLLADVARIKDNSNELQADIANEPAAAEPATLTAPSPDSPGAAAGASSATQASNAASAPSANPATSTFVTPVSSTRTTDAAPAASAPAIPAGTTVAAPAAAGASLPAQAAATDAGDVGEGDHNYVNDKDTATARSTTVGANYGPAQGCIPPSEC